MAVLHAPVLLLWAAVACFAASASTNMTTHPTDLEDDTGPVGARRGMSTNGQSFQTWLEKNYLGTDSQSHQREQVLNLDDLLQSSSIYGGVALPPLPCVRAESRTSTVAAKSVEDLPGHQKRRCINVPNVADEASYRLSDGDAFVIPKNIMIPYHLENIDFERELRQLKDKARSLELLLDLQDKYEAEVWGDRDESEDGSHDSLTL
jgi:hypothetical protein